MKAVMFVSGKGGTGKTTICCNVAFQLAQRGRRVCVVDADPFTPCTTAFFEILDYSIIEDAQRKQIRPFRTRQNVDLISVAAFQREGVGICWDGAQVDSLLNSILNHWSLKDYEFVLIDMPSGTGDEFLAVTKHMNPLHAVVVSGDEPLVRRGVERCKDLLQAYNIPILCEVYNFVLKIDSLSVQRLTSLSEGRLIDHPAFMSIADRVEVLERH